MRIMINYLNNKIKPYFIIIENNEHYLKHFKRLSTFGNLLGTTKY